MEAACRSSQSVDFVVNAGVASGPSRSKSKNEHSAKKGEAAMGRRLDVIVFVLAIGLFAFANHAAGQAQTTEANSSSASGVHYRPDGSR